MANYQRKKLEEQNFASVVQEKSVIGKLGEVRALASGKFTFDLINPETNEVKTYWLDGGLRGQFTRTAVMPGMLLEIVHTGQTAMENGNMANSYVIYELIK